MNKCVSQTGLNVSTVKSESLLCWLEVRSRDGRWPQLCSSDPSTQCSGPSHTFNLGTQEPSPHLNCSLSWHGGREWPEARASTNTTCNRVKAYGLDNDFFIQDREGEMWRNLDLNKWNLGCARLINPTISHLVNCKDQPGILQDDTVIQTQTIRSGINYAFNQKQNRHLTEREGLKNTLSFSCKSGILPLT